MKKPVRKTENRMRDQYTAVMERMESKIDLLVEVQRMTREELKSFKADTESNFSSVADYLVRIETEICEEKKADKVDHEKLFELEKRLHLVEKIFAKQKFANA